MQHEQWKEDEKNRNPDNSEIPVTTVTHSPHNGLHLPGYTPPIYRFSAYMDGTLVVYNVLNLYHILHNNEPHTS